ASPLRETGEARVDAVEERRLVVRLAAERRLDLLIRRHGRTRQRQQLRHALTFVHAARFGPDFRIRLAEERVVDGEVNPRQWSCRQLLTLKAEPSQLVQLLWLPRAESVFDLIRILRRVAGDLPRVARDDGRCLVMLT